MLGGFAPEGVRFSRTKTIKSVIRGRQLWNLTSMDHEMAMDNASGLSSLLPKDSASIETILKSEDACTTELVGRKRTACTASFVVKSIKAT